MRPKFQQITNKLVSAVFGPEFIILMPAVWTIIRSLIKNNGRLYTIRYLKTCRLHVTRYICGKPMYVNSDRVSVTGGWPTKFLFLKRLTGSTELRTIKFLLTVFNISKAVPLSTMELPPASSASITEPYKGERYTIPFWFIRDWVYTNKLALGRPKHSLKDHYLSMKQGPNGPTSLTVFKTVLSLSHLQLSWIMRVLSDKSILSKFYGLNAKHGGLTIDTGRKDTEYSPSKIKNWNLTGRLAIVHAPEGKERVIAITDYFTQFTLKPISDAVLRLVSKFPSDRTFTQNPYHNWKYPSHCFYSLDLKAATDRIPIELQAKLFEVIYNSKDLAEAWKGLLVERDYYTPEGKPLRYAVGQPMGCYSSWAFLAMVHHLIVAWSAHLCGIPGFSNYILLGDDIVIQHDEVAKKYIWVMTKLGVEISKEKTHVSKDTYEFAKRWIHKGKEITGLPLQGISENLKSPSIIYMILRDWFSKGNLNLVKVPLASLICRIYYNTPLIRKGKGLIPIPRQLIRRVYILAACLRFGDGTMTYQEFRQLIGHVTRNQPDYVLPPERLWRTEMVRVLSASLVSEVLKKVNYSVNLCQTLMNINEDLDFISTWPITHGVLSHIQSAKKHFQHVSDEDFNLQTLVRRLVFLDSTELTAWDRNKSMSALLSAKIFKKAILMLRGSAEELLTSGPYNTSLLDSSWMIPNYTMFLHGLEDGFRQLARR